MSKEERKVPELRFKGFHDDWEERKLNDVLLQMKSGLSRKLSVTDIGLPVIRANNINNGKLDLINDIKYWYVHDPQGAKTSNYLVKRNDILVNFINSESKMGTTAIVLKEPVRDTIYTTNIMKLKVNTKEYHPYFIFQQTLTGKYKNYIKIITKPAVNQSSFTTVDFKKYNFHVPNYNEQQKISSLLQNFDNLITLHQRKINTLETFKKVYLSVMFTNKNDNTPLLRFKNFTEAWEQCKFKNFVEDISTGRSSFISGKLQSNKNKFPILGSTNLIGYDSSYDYSGNFILTARVGANAGNIYRFQGDVKISDNTIYIQTKNWIFTYYLLLNFNLKRLAFGTGQPLIKASEIEKITFRLPSTAKEYRKIGQCLNNIDNLTTLHQRKLYTLKKLKQAYLNKMFI